MEQLPIPGLALHKTKNASLTSVSCNDRTRSFDFTQRENNIATSTVQYVIGLVRSTCTALKSTSTDVPREA